MSPKAVIPALNRPLAALKRAGQYRPPALIVLLWGGMVGVIASQWVLSPEPLRIQAFEIGVPVLLVQPLLYTAGYVTTVSRPPMRQSRILLMSLMFMVIASGTVALIVVSELATGGSFEEMLFPLVASSSVGVGIGSLVGLNYDDVIATRRELEVEVERTRRLNQRLTIMNRVLRHNVRNTLTLVLGRIGPVIEGVDDPDIRNHLVQCRQALESLHSSSENALHFEYLQARDVEEVEFNLATVIEQTCTRVRTTAGAATVRTDVPPGLTIRSHPLLPVAIEEGVQNAVEHNAPDGLTVAVEVTRGADEVTISITDDGDGIPPGELGPLDLDEETPLRHTSGVGLWLIKWIAEASNGRCTIRSPDGAGTTIRIHLPRE